ncbi:MAG: DUF1905 domain-containing protein [Myxococcota bacterium]
MSDTRFQAPLGQLEKRKGGYFFLPLDADTVDGLSRGKATRLIVTIDGEVTISCGLNHMGDGSFFIIVATRYLRALGKRVGDLVDFVVEEDPNPLGVEVPEVLVELLAQDEEAQAHYERLTDGRKRTLIHTLARIRDVDRQVHTALEFLAEEARKAAARAAKRKP